jgi:hypothetical protein
LIGMKPLIAFKWINKVSKTLVANSSDILQNGPNIRTEIPPQGVTIIARVEPLIKSANSLPGLGNNMLNKCMDKKTLADSYSKTYVIIIS